ncbi:MAG: PDZ domain-containing protein [Chlorobi bacterium]|nr:PDZ domain-containing protein [Chlorobiota bacterium]
MKIKNLYKKNTVIIIGIIISIFSVLFVSFDNQDFEIVKNLDIYYTLFKELNLFYVDETDPGKLVKTSIDDMLKSLDPYTVYIPESKMEDYKFMTTGQYGGVGALIRKSDKYIMIAEPYEDFPAAKAGLRAGDLILKIDDVSTENKTTQAISEILKGQPNTNLTLTVKRSDNENPFVVNITRQKIQIKSVPYYGMLNNNIGYIFLTNFTNKASKEVKAALVDLKDNYGAKSIVLDLRGNPGGLLIEAVNICNLFIKKGQEVVSTRGKAKQWDRVYKTMFNAIDTEIPLVVLVNSGSASASEIVSGTIQDLDRGVIIGQRTFGKGLVQTTRKLSYNAQLKVTTAKYYIPSGRCIQALDYTHRNADGSVGKVPDSLITQFSTSNGRKVYDGGGIIPDVKVESIIPGNIIISLIRKNLIFDFATQFRNENDSITNAEDFKLTDKDYETFKEFLKSKNYDYETNTEKTIDKLINDAKNEKYFTDISPLIDSMKRKLDKDKENDIYKFKDQIEELLSEEIVSRYYYQKGRIIAALDFDKDIEKATDILSNSDLYASILNGSYKNDTVKAKE